MYLLFCAGYIGILFFMQLLVGNAGLYLPFCAFGIFYLSVADSWRKAIFVALVAGTAIDSLYSRNVIITPFALCAIALYGQFWIRHYNSKHLVESIIPGILIPNALLIPLWLHRFYSTGFSLYQIKSALSMFIFTCAFGAAFLPLLIVTLDSIADLLRMSKYSDAKKQLLESRR
ncbi:MAG: hypothetical protein GY750_11160 [Lentisphaerae bacterium]|nr:hypothetical protein [Lentisphaerota bacterium]MCP4101971.1 hypothetical protein [Lentisphaerota bacterium]